MTEAFLTDLLDYVLVLEYPLERQKRVNLRKINHYRPVPGDSVVSQKLFSKREDLLGRSVSLFAFSLKYMP